MYKSSDYLMKDHVYIYIFAITYLLKTFGSAQPSMRALVRLLRRGQRFQCQYNRASITPHGTITTPLTTTKGPCFNHSCYNF